MHPMSVLLKTAFTLLTELEAITAKGELNAQGFTHGQIACGSAH